MTTLRLRPLIPKARPRRCGYVLVECAICVATIAAVSVAFLWATMAANQRLALAGHIASANALLDNYAELFRCATPDRRTNVGQPVVTMPGNLFTVPTTAGQWSTANATFSSPISGQPVAIVTRFQWTAPTPEVGGMSTGFLRTTYTLQIEIPTPRVPGMTTSSMAATTPMRFERSISKVF